MPAHIIPAPQTMTILDGHVPLITSHDLDAIASAVADWAPGAAARLEAFAQVLASSETDIEYVDDLPMGEDGQDAQDATDGSSEVENFAMTAALREDIPAEGFNLTLSPTELLIEASDASGALYAVNALIQALSTPNLEPFAASSAPQYSVRGQHLDIARHFFGVEDIKRVIDISSTYNLNRLHLHLSDDQGWRIEIDGLPQLVEKASTNDATGGQGGYLTFAEYEEIQNYAEFYGMTVVPEIDLPGHTNALIVAMPELSPDGKPREPYAGIEVGFSWVDLTSDATWQALETIISSLAKRTHGEYFHIGGDEVLQVARPQYEAFMERLGALTAAQGKKVVAWHETAGSAQPEDTQLQFWTANFNTENLERVGSTPGLQFIASPAPHAYLDLKPIEGFDIGLEWAGIVTLDKAYNWVPGEAVPVPADKIVGVESCLWSETVKTFDNITTLLLPRLPAVASVAWGSPSNFDQFTTALVSHGATWTAQNLEFYRAPEVDWA